MISDALIDRSSPANQTSITPPYLPCGALRSYNSLFHILLTPFQLQSRKVLIEMPVKFKGLFRSRGSRSQSSLPTLSPLTLEPSSSQAAAPPDPPAQPSQTTISPSLIAINTQDSPAPIGEGQNYGVQVLYDSGTEASIDIVFVHGLTGDVYNTWLHKNTRVYWPSQLLRQDIPDARILSFGYNIDIVNF